MSGRSCLQGARRQGANGSSSRKDAPPEPDVTLRPQLATLAETLPTGAGWPCRPKWDGYQAIVAVAASGAGGERAATAPISPSASQARADDVRAVMPSSAVHGRPVPRSTRTDRRVSRRSESGSGRLVLMAFDLLVLDGEPVHERLRPERRELLEEALDPSVDGGGSRHRSRTARRCWRRLAPRGSRASWRSAPMLPTGRGADARVWRKVKLRAEEDFPIVGYTRGSGRRASSAHSSSDVASRTGSTGPGPSAPGSAMRTSDDSGGARASPNGRRRRSSRRPRCHASARRT